MVSRRVRVDLAAAAAGWLLPWGAWLAGDGGALAAVLMVTAAFRGTPLLALPLAAAACALQWGVTGAAAFAGGLAGLATGRPVPPGLLGQAGLLLGWLGLAWRAAAAASRQATRAGVEAELRQGGLGWLGLAALTAWAPPRLLGPALLGLGLFVGGAVDGLAASQLHEFERRFGALAERGGYRSVSGAALGIVAAGATLAAWILAGGGGILPAVLHAVDGALVLVLTPVFILVGYVAQVFLAVITWLLHGRRLQLPQLNPLLQHPPGVRHAGPPPAAPAWAVVAGRWLLILAVAGAVGMALALLRAPRPEAVAEAAFTEEREALGAGGAEGSTRWGTRARPLGPDLAIRRLFRRWLGLAADRGRGRAPAETAREHFRRALAGDPQLAAAAWPLLRAYERGRYGRGGEPADLIAAEAALDRIRREWRP